MLTKYDYPMIQTVNGPGILSERADAIRGTSKRQGSEAFARGSLIVGRDGILLREQHTGKRQFVVLMPVDDGKVTSRRHSPARYPAGSLMLL